jgi:hypothetical protein
MPKKKAAPAPDTPKPKGKRRGWLLCDRCTLTVEHTEGPEGWPLHRCTAGRISEVRPFDRWSDKDPKPPLTSTPSPLEGP